MKSLQAYLLNGMFRVFVKHGKAKDLIRLRAKNEKLDARRYTIPEDVSIHTQDINHVPCQWISAPQSNRSRIMLYFHGGAFCLKFPNAHALFVARLCRSTGATGIVPDYRLAPEHPFPAAPEDCLEVYKWLLANGFDPDHVVIAGDSAGGNLVLSTLLQVREAGLPLPACGVMFSPATDMTLRGASFVENKASDVMFTLNSLMVFRLAYMQNTPPTNPLLSPLYGEFHDLPPLFFQVSRSEMLRDSSVLAARKAEAAGVNVVLDMHDGMPHCFGLFGILPESRQAVDNAVRFINSRKP